MTPEMRAALATARAVWGWMPSLRTLTDHGLMLLAWDVRELAERERDRQSLDGA